MFLKSQMGQRQPYGLTQMVAMKIPALLSPILISLYLNGCNDQDPAFKEDVSTTNIDSANATRKINSKEADGLEEDPVTKKAVISKIGDTPVLEPEPTPPPTDGGGPRSNSDSDIKSPDHDPKQDKIPVVVATPSQPTSQDDSVFIPAPLPPKPSSPTPGSETISGTEGGVGSEGSISLNWKVVEFTQGGPGKVDLLWVVDTSGSMSEEQAYLASNFNKMINALNAAGHDFQTAVTTTDVCQDIIPMALDQRVCPANYGGSATTHLRGSFIGSQGRKVLKKSDPDLIEKFNTYTKAGVNGSGFEHGLYAAKMAIDKVKSGENETLIRSDAFLAVIVVSDEEDDGIGLSMLDAYNGHNFFSEGLTSFKFSDDDMISYLKTVKAQGKFSISAIAPTKLADGSMCSAPHTAPLEEGTQYIKAAQKSGGLLQSLCDTDWSQSLATLGVDLSAQITQINLPSKPDPATIKVMANGQMTKDWTYNEANNAIKFNIGHVPPEGSQIYVGYYEKP